MRTVTASKVVYAPVQSKKKDDDGISLIRLGVRIELSDGNWWFYHFKYESFSKHVPGALKTTKSGSPVWEPGGTKQARENEKITRYGKRDELVKRIPGAANELLTLLDRGIASALEAEAEKRAARRA